MKNIYLIMLVLVSIAGSNVFAADAESGKKLSVQEEDLSTQCDLEARNALIHEDVTRVEKVCMQAIDQIGKSHPGQEVLINPIMNLAFSYTLTGQFDKATTLYDRARKIREKLYGADSTQLEEIDNMIKRQEEMKKHRKQ
ncbi:MAG: tetratricopeptide repeat protein [Nitrospirota bacterium]